MTLAAPTRIHAMPVLAIASFGVLGVVSMAAAAVLLAVWPGILLGDPQRPAVLAFTHVVTLGWIGSFLVAALYATAGFVTGTPLWSSALAKVHAVLHAAGMFLLAAGLSLDAGRAAAAGATLLVIGISLLVVNLVVTASERSLWTPSSLAVQTGLFWLAVAGGAAVLLVRARLGLGTPLRQDLLVALHLHLALFGFLVQVFLGVSLRVVPVLLGVGSAGPAGRFLGWTGWVLLNGGLLVLTPAVMERSEPGVAASGFLVAGGVAAFAAALATIAWRGRHHSSWDAALHGAGVVLLSVLTIGVATRLPGLEALPDEARRGWMRAYVSLLLFGPFSMAILGAAAILVPRVVWELRFRPWHRMGTLPTAAGLADPGTSAPKAVCLLLAVVCLGIGQVTNDLASIRAGAVLIGASVAWFLVGLAPAMRRLLLGVVPADLGLRSPDDLPPDA